MKYILFLIFSGSSGSGPTMPVMHSAVFDDRPACEAAAAELDALTRKHRVLYSSPQWKCVPAGTPKAG